MIDALAAELLKLRTLRSHAALLACALLAVPVAAGMALLVATSYDNQAAADRTIFDGLGAGLGAGLGLVYLVAGALGARSITSEHATGLLDASLLGVPRRQVLLFAKAAALVVVTLPVGVLLAFALHAVTLGVLGERARQVLRGGTTLATDLAEPAVAAQVVLAGAGTAVAAVVGLGLGAVVRSTAGALAGLVVLLAALPVAAGLLPAPWAARVGSVLLAGLPEQIVSGDDGGVLAPAAAVAVLLAYPAAALTGGATAIAVRGRARRPLLAGGLVTAVLVSTAAAPGPGPAAALDWRPCGGELECTAIEVPVDWARPAGRTITVPLARLPATGVHRRIGTVVALPGGPGGSGIHDLRERAAAFGALRERFDVVGLDPRNLTDVEAGIDPCLGTGVWLTVPDSPAEFDALATANRETVERCRRADPEMFDHRDSASAARDVEAVRLALAEPQLSLVATSYDAVTAAAYARLFPRAVRALYVDGGINHLVDQEAMARIKLAQAEDQFARFVAWCAAATDCALHGRDVGAVWQRLTSSADRTPLPVPGERTTYSGFDLKVALAPDLMQAGAPPDFAAWQRVARLIADAADGDVTGIVAVLEESIGSAKVPSWVSMNATQCPDGRGFTDYAQYQRIRALGEQLSPHFADLQLWHPLGCAGWPAPVTDPPAPLPGDRLPPLLGAGTWLDFAETAAIVREVPGSSTVRYDGPGHGLYVAGDPCTIAHANRYLAFLRLPPPDTTCRPPP